MDPELTLYFILSDLVKLRIVSTVMNFVLTSQYNIIIYCEYVTFNKLNNNGSRNNQFLTYKYGQYHTGYTVNAYRN